MNPEQSPLRLNIYFVTELNIQANKNFKPDQPVSLGMDDVMLETRFIPKPDTPRVWEVVLRIFHQGKQGVNTPYFFSIELVGNFSVLDSYQEQKAEWLIRTNASAVLYSTAREVLRNAMSHGPFMPLILPTATFYTQETKDAIQKMSSAITPALPGDSDQ